MIFDDVGKWYAGVLGKRSMPKRGPAIPPPPVRRVWKAVEEASAKDRLRVAKAFSRGRLLAALSWNDRDGDYDKLDQETLAKMMADAVDVGGGEVSDIGSRRARSNPRKRSKFPLFVVQTIEVRKTHSAAEARKIAERHGGRKGGKIDSSKNYWRFRQVDPSKMTKRYVSLPLQHAIIVKALPKDVARKAKVSNSSKPLTAAELKRLWALQDAMKTTSGTFVAGKKSVRGTFSVGSVSTKMPPMKSQRRSTKPPKLGSDYAAFVRSAKKKARKNPADFERCVRDVTVSSKKRGYPLRSAYAVCAAAMRRKNPSNQEKIVVHSFRKAQSLKKAGGPEYTAALTKLREEMALLMAQRRKRR